MRPALVFLIPLLALCFGRTQDATTYIGHNREAFPGPQVYKDPGSGTLFYVETDGRHVAAISGEGKLLWSKDPFKDGHLPFYRTEKPQIVYIGPPPKALGQPGRRQTSSFLSSSIRPSLDC